MSCLKIAGLKRRLTQPSENNHQRCQNKKKKIEFKFWSPKGDESNF